MRVHLTLLVLLVLLSACGKVGDLFELVEVAEAVEAELADRHGLECEVIFNKVNGSLKTVSVVFDEGEVGDLAIGDIVALVEPSVQRHFMEKPEVLSISIVVRK